MNAVHPISSNTPPGPLADLLRLGLPDGDAPVPELDGIEGLQSIGAGGMGRVFRGRHSALGRDVAVKFIRSEHAQDPSFLARFEREARILASADHSGIVEFIECGEVDGEMYLVMEFIDGAPLSERLGSSMSHPDALRIVHDVALAVAAAHDLGIVHRDIKPENILIDAQGRVRITDFGLSRRFSGDGDQSVTVETVMGTPSYIAPERLAGAPGDARADVYALGVLLYEALAGHPPLGNYRPLSDLTPLPPAVDRVIDRALDPSPETRTATASAFALAVEGLRDSRSTPTFAGGLSMGDRFATGLKLGVGALLVGSLFLGASIGVVLAGTALVLGVGSLRLGYLFATAPRTAQGTRSAFRFLMLWAVLSAYVALLPTSLLEAMGVPAGASGLGSIRFLLAVVAMACASGVVYLLHHRAVRFLPLLRGRVESRHGAAAGR